MIDKRRGLEGEIDTQKKNSGKDEEFNLKDLIFQRKMRDI